MTTASQSKGLPDESMKTTQVDSDEPKGLRDWDEGYDSSEDLHPAVKQFLNEVEEKKQSKAATSVKGEQGKNQGKAASSHVNVQETSSKGLKAKGAAGTSSTTPKDEAKQDDEDSDESQSGDESGSEDDENEEDEEQEENEGSDDEDASSGDEDDQDDSASSEESEDDEQ